MASTLLAVALACCLYPYVAYPAILKVLSLRRRRPGPTDRPTTWPRISITIPVHNEAAVIGETLERILELDYPADRRQILVVSDASSDGTDTIVAAFAPRGVELLRLTERRGKTAAENAACDHLRGEIIVNTDASVRIERNAVKHLVAALADPDVGVASGRDVSVARADERATSGEAAYVGYEMWVRSLETAVAGIVGASGCLYAIRAPLHRRSLPDHLSRDFAAALVARRHGYRAVSVSDAICYVPRSGSLRREYRRKVRTMARGLRTLWHERALLDPTRDGIFAWMLFSHKLCRWLLPWAAVAIALGLAISAPSAIPARAALGAGALGTLCGLLGWLWPEARPMPRLLAVPAYVAGGFAAGLHAWITALAGRKAAIWEPTRRPRSPVTAGSSS